MASDEDTRVTSWAEVIRRAFEAKLLDLHTGMPGKIVRYAADKQQADVQPLLKGSFIDEDDVRQVESMPVIVNCPVMFPSAGGYSITFPVVAGDKCWITFSEAAVDALIDKGGEADPGDGARHALSDGFVYVGWRPFDDPLQDAPTDGMSLGKDDGPRIKITDENVEVTADTKVTLTVGAIVLTVDEDKIFLDATGKDLHFKATTITMDADDIKMNVSNKVAIA